MFGPVFARELVVTPRRPRHYLYRTVYVLALLVLAGTAWLLVNGTQKVRNVGDMAQFGALLFQILAPLQLALVTFLAALGSASAVAQEKDRRTFILLMLTEMTNAQLVLGKLAASLLNVVSMIVAAVPFFLMITLFGGVSFDQVGRVFGVTLATALAAASLGSTLALWREKTFQTLAMTALGMTIWIGVWEAVGAGLFFNEFAGLSAQAWGEMFSPRRAIMAATRPASLSHNNSLFTSGGGASFIAAASAIIVLLNVLSIVLVRVWNPTRELHPGQQQEGDTSIFTSENSATSADSVAQARATHVDARLKKPAGKARSVWDNPVLWREICTWAYGRKVLVIRLAYILFCVMAFLGLRGAIQSGAAVQRGDDPTNIVPVAAQSLAPLFLVSLVIVNALAVTSITNERDGQALDLLLVTDLTPKEFLFGKIGGVLAVTTLMIAAPMTLCVYLWWMEGLSSENLVFLLGGLAILNLFATMLGIHCGMIYENSRTAIGVSLGTLFFLCLGVATCMLMMISFSGSFQTQLIPFSLMILGGAAGLFVAIGARNPSSAIALASLLLPFITFHAITSFALHHYMTVFLVITAVYGFTIAAMLVPAVAEFDIAMGRTKAAGDD